MRIWADRGRTLPGRRDPEWIRLATPPGGLGQFTRLADPFGTGTPGGGEPFGATRDPFGVARDPFSATPDPRGDGR